MSEWTYEPSATRDGVTIPRFWIAVAISLLLHAAVFWKWIPDWRLPSAESLERGDPSGSLVVQIAPPARPAISAPAPAVTAPPAPRKRDSPPAAPRKRDSPPAAPPRARPAPPVIALSKPSPSAPALPSAAPPAPAPPPSPAAGDLASYIESRRQARAEAAPSPAQAPGAQAEDENARANRLAAANLASQRRMTFGHDPTKGGGIFTIQRLTQDNAEFIFFGWNKEIGRNTSQLIEVRRGNAADIRTAVVRRMIAIIREQEQGDFMWESKRLERTVTLSARLKDSAGLEEFMMSEFFEDARRPQYIRRD